MISNSIDEEGWRAKGLFGYHNVTAKCKTKKRRRKKCVGTMLHGEVTNILFESLSIAIDDTIKNVTLVIGQKQIASRGGKQK